MCAKKEEFKLVARVILSLTLCFALFISGAMAYRTSGESRINSFDMATVKADLLEVVDDKTYGSNAELLSEFEDSENSTVLCSDMSSFNELENISEYTPGSALTVAPYIVNTGAADVYVFMLVGIPKADVVETDEYGIPLNNGNPTYKRVFEFNANGGNLVPTDSNWKAVKGSRTDSSSKYDYYVYGYKTPLAGLSNNNANAVRQTGFLFDCLYFSNDYDPSQTLNTEECDLILKPLFVTVDSITFNTTNEIARLNAAWRFFTAKNIWDYPEAEYRELTCKFVSGDSVVESISYGYQNSCDIDTEITVPDAPSNLPSGCEFIGWVDEQGNTYYPGDEITVADLLLVDEVNSASGNNIFSNPNPVVKATFRKVFNGNGETVSVNGNNVPAVVRLMPYQYSDGEETLNLTVIKTDSGDGNGPWVNSYSPELVFWDSPMTYDSEYTVEDGTIYDYNLNCVTGLYYPVLTSESESFVYGIQPGTSIEELFSNHVYVQGNGYAVVESSCGNMAGTGTTIKIYSNNLDNDNDGEPDLVQQFTVVVFGDFNGDSLLGHKDWTLLSNALNTDANFDRPTNEHPEGDGTIDGDGIIHLGDACPTLFSENVAAYWAADLFAYDCEWPIFLESADADGIRSIDYECYFTQGYINGTINSPDYQNGDVYIIQNLGVLSSMYDWLN